ncbi:MFS transporter [Photobacterium profundum]|uniref:MFS transporter n=1 Tax=Photobacterium profundum TaxID=74109 RepID=UPI003D09C0B3
MRISPTSNHKEHNRTTLYLIAAVATLMGVGQNGLLVSLPILVQASGINLPTWSIIIAIGSVLFLPAAPFWGHYSDRHGPKKVIVQALVGFMVSFALLLIMSFIGSEGLLPNNAIIAGLVFARIIYGCTVAGMVPASQHWAILLCGEDNQLLAITTISAGLSTGRFVGPLLALVTLTWHHFAPLMLMTIFPFIALMVALPLRGPEHLHARHQAQKQHPKRHPNCWQSPPRALVPLLLVAICLCTAVALMQYSLSPLISQVTNWSTDEITQTIGYLLTLSAAVTLLTQLSVIKKKRLSISSLFKVGGLCFSCGFILFLIPHIVLFYPAITLVAFGAAMIVPAYTASVSQVSSHGHGIIAGYISMSHTIGYGISALLASLVFLSASLPIWVCVGCALLCLNIPLFYRQKEVLTTNQ